MAGTRSVFTRWERLQKLRDAGRWSEGDQVYGLPKVSTRTAGSKKKKKKEDEEGEGAEGAEGEGGDATAEKGGK
ncbi:MAG: small basic protein [Planctomycetes bacterium]|nr:small basic protein [Planctomycetota bacterium]